MLTLNIGGKDNDLWWIKPSVINHFKFEREEYRLGY